MTRKNCSEVEGDAQPEVCVESLSAKAFRRDALEADSETLIDSESEFADDDGNPLVDFPCSTQDLWNAMVRKQQCAQKFFPDGCTDVDDCEAIWEKPAPIADLTSAHFWSLTESVVVEEEDGWEALADMGCEEAWKVVMGNQGTAVSGVQEHIADEWDVIDARQRTHARLAASARGAAARTGAVDEPRKQQCKPRKPQQKLTAAKVHAGKVSIHGSTDKGVEVVVERRFQGKIKAREFNKTKRGGKQNYGFIEVNPQDLQALHEHPVWSSDLENDVFWHSKDCTSGYFGQDGQRAGDIVTFTVILKEEGGILQAKNIELKQRASWWHAAA